MNFFLCVYYVAVVPCHSSAVITNRIIRIGLFIVLYLHVSVIFVYMRYTYFIWKYTVVAN